MVIYILHVYQAIENHASEEVTAIWVVIHPKPVAMAIDRVSTNFNLIQQIRIDLTKDHHDNVQHLCFKIMFYIQ